MSTNDMNQSLPDTGCSLAARSNEVGIPASGRRAAMIPFRKQRMTSLAVEHSIKYIMTPSQCNHIPVIDFSEKTFVRLGEEASTVMQG